MTAQRGESVILKVGNGNMPTEGFVEVGGLKDTSFRLNNKIVEANHLASGKYRNLISQSGISHMVLVALGILPIVPQRRY